MGGLIEVPGEIVQAYEDLKNIRGVGTATFRNCEDAADSRFGKRYVRTVCANALDECVAEHRAKPLGSLNRIL